MIEFFAPGIARPKGSSRMIRTNTGHRVVEGSKYEKPWRQLVTMAAHEVMRGEPPLEGPLRVHFTFLFPRPKSHSTKKGLRPNAPKFHTGRPDASKLARSVEDALNGVVFIDDSAIALLYVAKVYTEKTPGVVVEVRRLAGSEEQALDLEERQRCLFG